MTVQPATAPAGGFTRLDVRVPNERDDEGTVKVDLKLPPGFLDASYESVPGWTVKVTKEKLAKPVKVEGFEVTEQVGRITWTGDGKQGVIGPGEFRDFGLSVAMPKGKPGSKLTFKALQTYQGGEVVRWIGPEDGDEPAPTVTLTAAGAGGGHGAPARAASAPAPAPPPPTTTTAGPTASPSRHSSSARSACSPGPPACSSRGARGVRRDLGSRTPTQRSPCTDHPSSTAALVRRRTHPLLTRRR